MTFGIRASHTLQSSGPGALNISRYLWSLCYQNCTHKFLETPGGAGPPLAAPLLENQVVRDGLTKETLKVKPECEEGASGAKTWGTVVQPEEAASTKALWHKGTGYVLQKDGLCGGGEVRVAQAGRVKLERWAQAE